MEQPPQAANNQLNEQALLEKSRQFDLLQAIHNTVDLPKLLELMTAEIKRFNKYDGMLINLLDRSGDYLTCEKIELTDEFKGIEQSYYKYKFPLEPNDANTRCMREKRAITITSENVDNYPGNTKTRFERWKMQTMAVVPIYNMMDIIGTVIVFSHSEVIHGASSAALQEVVRFFGTQLTNAMYFAYMREQEDLISKAAEEHERFLTFVSEVNDLSSVDQIYDLITKELLRKFSFDLAGVVMHEEDQLIVQKNTIIDDKFRADYDRWCEYYDNISYKVDVSDGTTPAVFIQNRFMFIPDISQIRNLPMAPKDKQALDLLPTVRTFYCGPIRQKGQGIGILWLWSLENVVDLSEQDKKMIDRLCSFIGTAIGNAKLYEKVEQQNHKIEELNEVLEQKVSQLHEMATKDNLTSLYNFGFFQNELSHRIMEYRRSKGKYHMAIIIIDVDHFKKFNDTYGHVAGNVALQDIAQRLLKRTRKMDVVCRYGGEEFVVILPKCDVHGAQGVAEKLRADIEKDPIVIESGNVFITASMGCAQYDPEEEYEEFVERADQALYRAKEGGRNRVEISDHIG
ncbi:MAG: sensor domain-containing diguanylate cyclase [Gammaproteobacteria bacterium]|nr:MAG: sensor domain-containing diguanylate cyclase [Gammaproteobacteria bacterium]